MSLDYYSCEGGMEETAICMNMQQFAAKYRKLLR